MQQSSENREGEIKWSSLTPFLMIYVLNLMWINERTFPASSFFPLLSWRETWMMDALHNGSTPLTVVYDNDLSSGWILWMTIN